MYVCGFTHYAARRGELFALELYIYTKTKCILEKRPGLSRSDPCSKAKCIFPKRYPLWKYRSLYFSTLILWDGVHGRDSRKKAELSRHHLVMILCVFSVFRRFPLAVVRAARPESRT